MEVLLDLGPSRRCVSKLLDMFFCLTYVEVATSKFLQLHFVPKFTPFSPHVTDTILQIILISYNPFQYALMHVPYSFLRWRMCSSNSYLARDLTSRSKAFIISFSLSPSFVADHVQIIRIWYPPQIYIVALTDVLTVIRPCAFLFHHHANWQEIVGIL
jgi:hypothetical protein